MNINYRYARALLLCLTCALLTGCPFDLASHDIEALDMTATSDGGYVILALEIDQEDLWQYLLIKMNSEGEIEWRSNLNYSEAICPITIIEGHDGGFVLLGGNDTRELVPYGHWENAAVIKTNATGNIEWIKIYDAGGYDNPHDICGTSDGGYAITGGTNSFGVNNFNAFLLKINANGDELWWKTYDSTYLDTGFAVRKTSDNGFIIAGRASEGNLDADIVDRVLLIKTGPGGDQEWLNLFGDVRLQSGYDVVETNDSGYAVAGEVMSDVGGENDGVFLLTTNNAGDQLWSKTIGEIISAWRPGLCRSLDGGYVIGGYNSNGLCIMKLDTFGDKEWTWESGHQDFGCIFNAIETDNEGYIAVGNELGDSKINIIVVRIDNTGETVWERRIW